MKSKLRYAIVAVAFLFPHKQSYAAEPFPSRPVQIILPFATGGSLSTLALALGQQLGTKWPYQPVIEARPGAGGNIGAESVARALPDGYTLLFGTQSLAANATLMPNSNFDPEKSFDPVVLIGTGQNVLVVPAGSPFKSLRDVVDAARSQPGKLNAATVGTGSTSYLATVSFEQTAGINVTLVPYNGAAPAATDLIAGRTDFWITTLVSVLPNIQSGQMRGLALTGNKRATSLPDVPTFAEGGYPTFKGNAWFALFAPAGTPREIAQQINTDVNEALTVDWVRDRFQQASIDPVGGPQEDLKRLMSEEVRNWHEILTKAGSKLN
jgi:tripartite-type tricarboxylate transporter receptor subunit TctC